MWTAGVQQLAIQFAKGDRHARRDVFWIAEKLGSEFLTPKKCSMKRPSWTVNPSLMPTLLAAQAQSHPLHRRLYSHLRTYSMTKNQRKVNR